MKTSCFVTLLRKSAVFALLSTRLGRHDGMADAFAPAFQTRWRHRSDVSSNRSIRHINTFISTSSTISSLRMNKNRGLERRIEGATPTEGGMTLYIKAGPDGTSVGDCPFAHFVRMVLEVKQLEYDLEPCVQESKPRWLLEYYDGKMPALRHRRECYVESDTIASYLDFFFPEPSLRERLGPTRLGPKRRPMDFFLSWRNI